MLIFLPGGSDMAPRPPSLGRAPAQPSRASVSPHHVSCQNPVCDFSARSRSSRVGGAGILSVLAPPAGTIGQPHSSLSTYNSKTTGAAVHSLLSVAVTTLPGIV